MSTSRVMIVGRRVGQRVELVFLIGHQRSSEGLRPLWDWRVGQRLVSSWPSLISAKQRGSETAVGVAGGTAICFHDYLRIRGAEGGTAFFFLHDYLVIRS